MDISVTDRHPEPGDNPYISVGLLKINVSFHHIYGHIGDRQTPGTERQSPTFLSAYW